MKTNIKDLPYGVMWDKELQSTHFNIHYNKSRQFEPIVSVLLGLVGKRFEVEVRSVVTNTARMVKSRAGCLKIPRARGVYLRNTQGISYTRMMDLLGKLEELSMINIYIGGVVSYGKGGVVNKTTSSVVEVLPPLLTMFSSINKDLVCTKLLNPVEIKQRKTRIPLSTQGVAGVKEIKERVEMFNTALVESRISLKGVELPDQKYKRSFIENLKTGGRWYNSCGGVQTMEKSLRPFLQIDGENLVELDYSAIHPNICYELINAELSDDFDPYALHTDYWEIHEDPNQIHQFKVRHGIVKYNPMRNLIKMAVMIGLNCSSIGEATKALSQHIGQDKRKWGGEEDHKSKYYGLNDLKPKELLLAVQEHNHLIQQYFFSDIGVELQYIDSVILDSIICDTLAIGEVLLPYHDGVLVKEDIAEQVKGFMYKAWYTQFNSVKFCHVEYK